MNLNTGNLLTGNYFWTLSSLYSRTINKITYPKNIIQYSFSCRIPHYKGGLWAGIHSLKDITSAEGQRNERKFEKKDVAIYESNL